MSTFLTSCLSASDARRLIASGGKRPCVPKNRWTLYRSDAFAASQGQKKRRQERMEAMIRYPEPSTDYYENSPIKPGLQFWKCLLGSGDVGTLRMHIPDTLLVAEKVYWARTLEDGRVECLDEFSYLELYRSFSPEDEAKCAVLRVPEDEIAEMHAVLLSWQEFGDKVLKSQLPRTGLLQKYVHGRRGSSPSVTRLLYVSQSKRNKASCGFTIRNLTAGSLVQMDADLDVIPLCSAALTQVARQGRVIVEFLQVAYKVRIEEIALDFIHDSGDRYCLIGCKGFLLDMVAQRTRELRCAEEEGLTPGEIREMRAEQLEHQLSAMQCRLCLLPYRPDELRHVLPFKLLLLFKRRSNHRVLDLNHLRGSSLDFLSYSVRLCDICYMLVLQENELLHIQMRLARLLHVPMRPPELLEAAKHSHPTYMPAVLQQWRILFFFKSISRVVPNLRIQYSLWGRAKSLPLNSPEIHMASLHHVFVQEGSMAECCQSLTLTLHATRGQSLEDTIWKGECRPLAQFSASGTALVQPHTVLLFAKGQVQASVKLLVGIALDKDVSGKDLYVSIERFGCVYVPDAGFFSSDPLPGAWVEAFEADYEDVDPSVILDSSEELEVMYSPVLPNNAVFASNIGSTRVLHMAVDLSPLPTPRKLKETPKRVLCTPNFSIPLLPSIEEVTRKLFSRQSTQTTCRTPVSATGSTSRVLYQQDSSKLKSPTFLTARQTKSAAKRRIEVEEVNNGELKEVVQKYLQHRSLSGNLPTAASDTETPARKVRQLSVQV